MCTAPGRPPREVLPERVAQRAAGQRQAERVVLVHRVGDEAEAAARVEQLEAPGWCGWCCHPDPLGRAASSRARDPL
jgi:hypothetical protein